MKAQVLLTICGGSVDETGRLAVPFCQRQPVAAIEEGTIALVSSSVRMT
jgi:hypothetical protein